MHPRSRKDNVYGEFHLRGQNSRVPPLRIRWRAPESLYYGGEIQILGGPGSMRARFERRMADLSWLKNDPNRVAGGRGFGESYYATVAVLLAFADAERLVLECAHSPVPMTSTTVRQISATSFGDIEDFDRERNDAPEAPAPTQISGIINAG